ncbi:MAG: hypothetical protein A3G34_12150 [Candidatus Lindowbacteria bacterium RIFCSPLOWO2_12_FULL_62_27]|nr:MAG: hypothetical protein A3G34_12150 [Candidatus Lindowbacteria bacterium RIFCSPLOWO2_12_FULL_62_27]OGH63549.1 MAG: hypothetical protein A3I06_05245 [Candidatus Lindowbacteria bacterium RIFCSPLOWO2_02_FULL_62_12]
MSIRDVLFPEKDRAFRGERALRIAVRTAHLASMGILLGGHVFDLPAERLFPAMLWTAGTGAAYAVIELYCSFNWLFQVRGLLTLAKIGLVLLVPLLWEQRVWILSAVLILGSVGSHMPATLRYYSLLTRTVGAHKKG